jgi:hypothetical protein
VHPRVVTELLRNAQMRTTTDTYSHVMPALGRDAVDRWQDAVGLIRHCICSCGHHAGNRSDPGRSPG